MLGRTIVWVTLTILSAAIAFAAGQQTQQAALPTGPGKQILDRACTSCHGLDPILNSHLPSKAEYADIVSNMIGVGATVTKEEEPILVDYLWDNLGKKPAKPETDPPGKIILDAACTACHGLEGLKNHVYDKEEAYKSLVVSMVSLGATVSDAQVPVLTDYLFKTYGKK